MDGEIPATELASALDDEEPLVVESDSLGRSGASGFPGAGVSPCRRRRPRSNVSRGQPTSSRSVHTVEASVRAARLVASFEAFDGRVESLAGGLEGWHGPMVSDTGSTGPTAPF